MRKIAIIFMCLILVFTVACSNSVDNPGDANPDEIVDNADDSNTKDITNSDNSGKNTASNERDGDVEKVPLNQPIVFEGWQIDFHSMDFQDEIVIADRATFTADSGMTYLIANITVKNTADKRKTFMPTTYNPKVDVVSRIYFDVEFNFGYASPMGYEGDLYNTILEAGETKTGVIIYIVDKRAQTEPEKPLAMRFLLDDKKAQFDLRKL